MPCSFKRDLNIQCETPRAASTKGICQLYLQLMLFSTPGASSGVPVSISHLLPEFVCFWNHASSQELKNGACNSVKVKALVEVQFSSVAQSCLTLCDPMDCSTPGLPVHHQLPEFTQTHVHWVGDTIQPFHSLLSPSHPAFNLSQHKCLFKWVSSSHQVTEILEFQLQHQSLQWIFRTDFL